MKSHGIGSSTRFQSNTKVKWSARTGHPNTMYKKAIKHKRCNVLYFLCKRVNSIAGVTEKVAPAIEFNRTFVKIITLPLQHHFPRHTTPPGFQPNQINTCLQWSTRLCFPIPTEYIQTSLSIHSIFSDDPALYIRNTQLNCFRLRQNKTEFRFPTKRIRLYIKGLDRIRFHRTT